MLVFSDAKTPSSFLIHIPKTGALCCVAAGPHGEKPVKTGREDSLDLGEPHWRTNSSFSPPSSRIWDCRLQSDGLSNEPGASVHGTSASSSNKRSRRGLSSERYPNHQHSVSDGILSYSGFPPENVQSPQWTSPIQKFNFDNFATPPLRGLRSETAWRPHPTERQNAACASVASCSYASPSSLTESRSWECKQPSFLFPGRYFNSRRSFMSKPVYRLLIHNPVSDEAIIGEADACSVGRLTPGNDVISPSNWLGIHRNIEHNFHKILEPSKEDTTTDPSSNSRREDFRWSNASSYDMEFDGENLDVFEHIDVEGQRSPSYHTIDQKCGVCTKLLRQKSPWGSNRIMRSGDLPIAGILPCSHVFHAECLEQATPKPQIQDPPCPLCLKAKGLSEDSPAFSEPLVMALRSVRQRRGAIANDVPENTRIDEVFSYMRGGTMQISSSSKSPKKSTYSLVTNQFRKQFSFKGKTAKDFFSTKVFSRARSSSSSRETVQL